MRAWIRLNAVWPGPGTALFPVAQRSVILRILLPKALPKFKVRAPLRHVRRCVLPENKNTVERRARPIRQPHQLPNQNPLHHRQLRHPRKPRNRFVKNLCQPKLQSRLLKAQPLPRHQQLQCRLPLHHQLPHQRHRHQTPRPSTLPTGVAVGVRFRMPLLIR